MPAAFVSPPVDLSGFRRLVWVGCHGNGHGAVEIEAAPGEPWEEIERRLIRAFAEQIERQFLEPLPLIIEAKET